MLKKLLEKREKILLSPIKEDALVKLLKERRSYRNYKKEALKEEELSYLAWIAYGKSESFRTIPSAGALFPLSLYIVINNVENLEKGIYRYEKEHVLIKFSDKDVIEELAKASFHQLFIASASLVMVICASFEKTTSYYGRRGIRYVFIEAGHMGQNIYLAATNLGLGTVAIGAFDDESVKRILGIKEDPLYLMPVGRIEND